MEWKCFIDEHLNGPNLTECEVCGTPRNLYAEETFILKEENQNLKSTIKALRFSNTLLKNKQIKFEETIKELQQLVDASNANKYFLSGQNSDLKSKVLQLNQFIKFQKEEIEEINRKLSSPAEKMEILKLKTEMNKKNNLIYQLDYDLKNQKKIFKFWMFYFFWFIANLSLLISQINKVGDPQDKFWPFSNFFKFYYYDYTEFLIYSLVPFFCMTAYKYVYLKYFKSGKLNLENWTSLISGVALFPSQIYLVYIFLLNLENNESNKSIDYATFYESHSTNQVIVVAFLFIRFIFTFWIIRLTKKKNEIDWNWALAGFLFPSITIMIASLKDIKR